MPDDADQSNRKDRTHDDPITGSDTGEDEPPVSDRPADRDEAPRGDVPGDEAARGEAAERRESERDDSTSAGGSVSHRGFVLDEIHENPRGDDADHLDDEYLVFENEGDAALDLGGWRVSNEEGETYAFPGGFRLDPGEQVTLRTGRGRDTDRELHWGADAPVWKNTGDVVTVRDAEGRTVLDYEY